MTAFSYAVAEWREWRDARPHPGLLVAALILAGSASFLWLGPFALSLSLPAAALALGWAGGGRYGSGARFRKLLLGSGIEPHAGALGKALEAAAEAVWTGLALSPPAVLVLVFWERGAADFVLLPLTFLACFLLSAAAGFTLSLAFGGPDRLPSLYYLGAFVVPTALFPELRFLSPFFQAGAALGAGTGPVKGAALPSLGPFFLGALVDLVLAALLFAAGGAAIRAARRRDAD
jgi:hypothetical protein